MTPPKNSNVELATLRLEQLSFAPAIRWQQTIAGSFIARWRRDDLLATLILDGRKLTIALTSRTDFSVPCKVPKGAKTIAQSLVDAGVVFVAKPEGVL